MVLGAMGFPFWENDGSLISLHDMKDLHFWSELLVPTEPTSLSIEYVHIMKRSKRIIPHPVIFLKPNSFFTGPKSGKFFYHTSNYPNMG